MKCTRTTCFAYNESVSNNCKILTDTNFEKRKCPFYKTQRKFEEDLKKAEEREKERNYPA